MSPTAALPNDSTSGCRARWPAASACLLVLLATPLVAELGPIGLTTEGAQWFVNDDPTSPFDTGDSFGETLAVGDFNGDGVDDLATGVPSDDMGAIDSGSVVVRYASSDGRGLVPGTVGIVLRQDAGSAHQDERFGSALAAGDFNGDSFDDLAVGVPRDRPSGAVRVYYGSSLGLEADLYEVLDEVAAGGADHLCGFADFGRVLVVGNFDGDPFDDLAIGVPSGCEARPEGAVAGGSLYVAHGKANGLVPFLGYRISQDSFGIYDEVEWQDAFARAVAAGDFNADGYDDLAIGIPGEDSSSGAIDVVMGSQWGLLFADSVFWLPGALGEEQEQGDQLGSCLATGDFDGDGIADLAIGTPYEDSSAGAVDVAYGAPDPFRFDLSRTDRLTESSIHGPGHDGVNRFGWSLAGADFDGDGRDDLAIGHPLDGWRRPGLGVVTVLMGAVPSIASSTRHQVIAIGWDGVPGDPSQPTHSVGWALAAGDLDGSGRADLAIGVPGYAESAQQSAGAEVVLYSETHLFTDGFESVWTVLWSDVFPWP